MKIKDVNYRFEQYPDKDNAFLLMHGISEGMDSEFMHNIESALIAQGRSVLAFDLPYLERGEKPTDQLIEEREALQDVATFIYDKGYQNITIIAKSLGGIISSRWLRQYPDNPNVDVHIFGYVLGDVDTLALKDHLGVVVQGDHDRFGGGSKVRAELKKHGVQASVLDIPHADHSYRNPSREPVHQQRAIRMLLKNIL